MNDTATWWGTGGMTRAINVVAIDWVSGVRLDLLCSIWVEAENIR